MSEPLYSSASVASPSAPVKPQISMQPSVVTVGVVLYQWNEPVRKRVQLLGAQLGKAGVKMQLLTHSDIVRQDDKAKSLHAVIYQLPANAEAPMAKRFNMVFNHSQQFLLQHCRAAAAFSIPEAERRHSIESAIAVSMTAHTFGCNWLGFESAEAQSVSFQDWCEGIALSVRQLVGTQSVLAA